MLEIGEPWGPVVRGLLLTIVAVLWTVALVRVVGLRSFSKMTSFDFVATIATGSLIAQAGTRSDWGEFLQALAAITGVFLVQWLLAKARQRSEMLRQVIVNQPVLLMEGGRFLEDALKETRVSRSNLMEKLRSAGVSDLEQVRAAVLETTGEISVIRGDEIDPRVMQSVRRL